MKTFNIDFQLFLNKVKFGEDIAKKIYDEEKKQRKVKFKEIEYCIENFTNFNYLEQIYIIEETFDSHISFVPLLTNHKDKDYIKSLMGLVSGNGLTKNPNYPKLLNTNYEDFFTLFNNLDFELKVEVCIFLLTSDLTCRQETIFRNFTLKKKEEYREIYEMMVNTADIIEKNESFLIVKEVRNLYNALERDRKISEIFE